MSGINSLLKYRYQKKGSSNEPANRASPITISSSSTSVHENSSASTSPTFPSKIKKAGERSSNGASTSLKSATSDDSSSPWLSKDRPSRQAKLVVRSRAARKVDDSDESSQSDSSTASSLDPRDLQAKMGTLKEMFPDVPTTRLEEALNIASGDVDFAVDMVIKQKVTDDNANQRKRKYAIFQPSAVQSSQDKADKLKRARKLSSSDDESPPKLQKMEPLPIQPEPQPVRQESLSVAQTVRPLVPPVQPVRQVIQPMYTVQPQVGRPPTKVEPVKLELVMAQNDGRPDACVIYERIKFLQEAFPNISRQELKRVLTVSNYEVDLAVATLTSYQTGGPVAVSAVSLTKNVGSIKAFMANRAQVQALTPTTSAVSTESATINSVDAAPVKKERRHNVIDSGSDSEVKIEDRKVVNTKSTNQLVIDFFCNATIDELTIMNGCSRKKAELIVQMRPFTDWNDLVSKIDNCQALPSYLIGEGHEVIRLRSAVSELMKSCEDISSELTTFVADLTSRTSIDETDTEHNYIAVQPACLTQKMQLKPYQMIGLNWLLIMHSHDLNGILGDEMGLGKTIQTIAFLAQLHLEGVNGPHVIIAPSSTIDNWLRELQLWCPALNVLLYYGSQESRRTMRNDILDGISDDFHVLLTSYNMASGSAEDRFLFKKMKFYYAVFDEGHMLKNMESVRYKSLTKIRAKRRLLLTGTPLQNNLVELMSLLAFLMPHLFVSKTDVIKRVFATFANRNTPEDRGTYEQETLSQTKLILKPFFLRRLKTEVLQQLPLKTTSTVCVPMSFEQQDLYEQLVARFTRDIDSSKDTDGKSAALQQLQSGSSMLMQLRKAANHHLLHRRQFDDCRLHEMSQLLLKEPSHRDANVEFIYEDMQVMSDFELHKLCIQYKVLNSYKLDEDLILDSGKFRHLDQVLPVMKTKGDRVLLFSQFTMVLDIVEDYMKARDHKYIRLDGQTPVVERQDLIDTFNTDQSLFVFLLSTKAGGLGINLTAANVVILHDIDFNPYNDKQAEDRCHRVGQTRDVTIYRLISKNTIEEGMLRCAESKLKLESDVTGTDEKETEDLSTNDVASLLKEALRMR